MATKTHTEPPPTTRTSSHAEHQHEDAPAHASKAPAHAHEDATTPPAHAEAAAALPTQQATPVVQPLAPPTGAKKATHFHGPVCVGKPGAELIGQVMLCYRFDIDQSTGNFGGTAPGVPLVFPIGSLILRIVTNVTVAFVGSTPKFNLGTTVGGTDIASIAIATVGKTETPAAPALLPVLPANNTIYASVTGAPFSAGHASIALEYLGAPNLPWS